MYKTEDQLLITMLTPLFLVTLPSIVVAGFIVFAFSKFLYYWWVFLCLFILALIAIQIVHNKNKNNIRDFFFEDKPKPLMVDIVKMSINPIILGVMLYFVSIGLMQSFSAWGITTPEKWVSGIVCVVLWMYCCDITSSLCTVYRLSDHGVCILHGIDIIYIPFSKITSVIFLDKIKKNFEQFVRTGFTTYIPGVRRGKVIALKLKLDQSIISIRHPEIYITPSDPNNFLETIRKKISTQI